MPSIDLTLLHHNLRLAATLYLPEGRGPHPAMAVAHAANQPLRSDEFYTHLRRRLPRAGLAVLLYDRRGSGRSGGDFATASFDDLADDLLAGVAALRGQAEIDAQRVGLFGVSQGGWIAPIAAARDPRIAFLALVSPSGVSPAAQMDYAAAYHLREAGFDEQVVARALALRGRINAYFRGQARREDVLPELRQAAKEAWFAPAQLALDDLPPDVTRSKWFYELDHDPLAAWAGARQPTLIFLAGRDRWVPVYESIARYHRVLKDQPNASINLLPAADHWMRLPGQTGEQVSEEYLYALQSWLRRRAILEP